MKKFAFQIIGLLLVALGAMAVTFNPSLLKNLGLPQNAPARSPSPQASPVQQVVKISSTDNSTVKATVNVEVADNTATRAKGLGDRSSLAQDSGMLFIFDKTGTYTFWMKGMEFPLDFIWINNGQVVDLLQNIKQPSPDQSDDSLERYAPITVVSEVLEVNAGFIAAHNIVKGDLVKFN